MYPAAFLFCFGEGEGKEAQRINSFPLILVFIPRKVKNPVFRTCLEGAIIYVDSWIPLILLCIQASDAWGRRTCWVWEYLSSHKVNTVQGRIKTRQISLTISDCKTLQALLQCQKSGEFLRDDWTDLHAGGNWVTEWVLFPESFWQDHGWKQDVLSHSSPLAWWHWSL